MRRQAEIEFPKSIMRVTGPAVIARDGDHARAYGVEFNVSLAGEEIGFGFDETGFVAAFPECPRATIHVIDVTHVTSSDRLQRIANRCFALGRNQQMNMIGHQYVGMDGAGIFLARFLEEIKIEPEIIFGKENRVPGYCPVE